MLYLQPSTLLFTFLALLALPQLTQAECYHVGLLPSEGQRQKLIDALPTICKHSRLSGLYASRERREYCVNFTSKLHARWNLSIENKMDSSNFNTVRDCIDVFKAQVEGCVKGGERDVKDLERGYWWTVTADPNLTSCVKETPQKKILGAA